MTGENGHPSYHDLYITTADIPRARLFDLPYGLEVTCNRVAGWRLVKMTDSRSLGGGSILAGEYDGPDGWLVLDVAGHVIVDSRREPEGNEDEPAYAECEGCTCCTRQGCHRGPDSECPYSDQMLSFLCPCTED